MKNCISYSLFGYNKERKDNCFDFNSYLRGLMINVRMNRLIYPGWENVLHVDSETFRGFYDLFSNVAGLRVIPLEEAPMCLAMLWRIKPAFEMNENNVWKYDHVLCRDLDSPTTYREAQAVQYWINREKAMHAITDSVSHNLPLMGGMIGIRPAYFNERSGQSWQEMMSLGNNIDYSVKGSDQAFLNKYIYPMFATKGTESITQHYILGHGDTFLNDYHNSIPNLELPGVAFEMSESNEVCGHVGAAGFYGPPMFKFLRKHKDKFTDLIEVEKKHANIFSWCLDGTFE